MRTTEELQTLLRRKFVVKLTWREIFLLGSMLSDSSEVSDNKHHSHKVAIALRRRLERLLKQE